MPQVEVTFDIDANGIMNVHAQDKGTGKSSQVTITNDKGRLSKDDIDRMVSEAERYKQQDETVRKRIEAKNGLESYTYNLKNTLNEENVRTKISHEDKTALEAKIQEATKWLETNTEAAIEQYEAKQKEIEAIANPIMQKIYADGGMPEGMPGGMPGGNQGGMPGGMPGGKPGKHEASKPEPTVEEVD